MSDKKNVEDFLKEGPSVYQSIVDLHASLKNLYTENLVLRDKVKELSEGKRPTHAMWDSLIIENQTLKQAALAVIHCFEILNPELLALYKLIEPEKAKKYEEAHDFKALSEHFYPRNETVLVEGVGPLSNDELKEKQQELVNKYSNSSRIQKLEDALEALTSKVKRLEEHEIRITYKQNRHGEYIMRHLLDPEERVKEAILNLDGKEARNLDNV